MDKTVTLNNGVKMPLLGLGTWKMSDGEETETAVRTALEMGYRLIDTAKLYGNEKSVGKAVKASGIRREDIFVTTKLFPTDFFFPEKAFRASLQNLDIGYIDLYLIHWPTPFIPQNIWQTLEKMYEAGLARAIGVSNYGLKDFEKLQYYERVVPAVNQIEFNPFSLRKDIVEYCRGRNIVIEAYSPLTRGAHLHDEVIEKIAAKYGKTTAQILIRWCLEHGTVVIPKSSRPQRIKENSEVFDFELNPADMAELNAISG